MGPVQAVGESTRTLLRVYAGSVMALGLGAATYLLSFGVNGQWETLFLLASLAGLSSVAPVRIPALKTSVSVNDPFTLTALAALGPCAAAVVAVVGVIGGAMRQRPRPFKLAFNLANIVLSTGVAALVFGFLGSAPGTPMADRLIALAVATLAYFMTNTWLVTTAVVLDGGGSSVKVWKETVLWSAIAVFVGLTLASILLLVLESLGNVGLALGVPPCWLLATFVRTHRDRQEQRLNHIAEVEQLNQRLEDKVAERTKELRRALDDIEAANNRLRTTNERLTEANRAKSEFLANVSHELRTPLNAIIGFSELLQDGSVGSLSAEQEDFVRDIHDSGGHLLGLINNILDLSKIEAGRIELHRETCDLYGAIQEALAMVKPQAAKRGLVLHGVVAPGLETALIDPGMFKQVLINLLSNGVKFTEAGGRVEVRASAEHADLIVAVSDTGIGIAADAVSRIFDEFYQVDGSYSRNYEGTGLGLALVRKLMHEHDGTITVDSVPGRGSTFTCCFPGALGGVAAPAPDPAACRAAEDGRARSGLPRLERERVLVVEDNAVNRKLVRSILRREGYQVFEAIDGEAAIEFLETQSVDLVLMDLQLPGLDGLEVTRRLRARPALAATPIVALTAHVREADESRAREAGCVGYVTKPIRIAEFPAQIRAFLPAPHAAAAGGLS